MKTFSCLFLFFNGITNFRRNPASLKIPPSGEKKRSFLKSIFQLLKSKINF